MPKNISKAKGNEGPSNNFRERKGRTGASGVTLGMMVEEVDSDEEKKPKPALITQIFHRKTEAKLEAKPNTIMAMFAHANKQQKARPLERKETVVAEKRIPDTDMFNKYKMGGDKSKEI